MTRPNTWNCDCCGSEQPAGDAYTTIEADECERDVKAYLCVDCGKSLPEVLSWEEVVLGVLHRDDLIAAGAAVNVSGIDSAQAMRVARWAARQRMWGGKGEANG